MLGPFALGLAIALGASSSGAGGSSSGLAAAAASSGRPRECAPAGRRSGLRGPTIWQSARSPMLAQYCDTLARAQAELANDPDAAKTAALEADKLLPGHASPHVILARAALAAKAYPDAAQQFARALEIDPRAAEDPPTMHDLARAFARTGDRARALATYRALVPRIDLLPAPEERTSVLLEAAFAAMAIGTSDDASAKAAETRLDEAIAYLREARQRPATQLTPDVLVSLALALDRAGERAQADAALGDAQHAGAHAPSAPVPYIVTAEDQLAYEGIARELDDRPGAQKAWETYLSGAGGKGPWAAAARARLEAIRKGAPRAKPSAGARERRAGSPAKP